MTQAQVPAIYARAIAKYRQITEDTLDVELLSRLQKSLEDLTKGAASMAFPPASLVFGAVTHLIGAAKGLSDSYDTIHDLLIQLKDLAIRLGVYSYKSISGDLSNKISDILLVLIEDFALSAKAIRRGSVRKFTRNFSLETTMLSLWR
ncbi:hypothetical protein BDW68DRAFT_180987 [Aspergillus falconensis]